MGKLQVECCRRNAVGEMLQLTWRYRMAYEIQNGVMFVHSFDEEEFGYWKTRDFEDEVREIVIDEGIKEIPESSFEYFKHLEKVQFPASLTTIGKSAFTDCPELTEIRLPEGVTSIGDAAFQNDVSVRRVFLPQSLTGIGLYAISFGHGSRLFSVEVAEGNPVYASEQGILYNRDRTELILYPAAKRAKKFVVPETVTRLGDGAFTTTSQTSAAGHLPSVRTSKRSTSRKV